VVGIVGRGLAGFGAALPTRQVRDSATFGVLALALHPDGHDGSLVPAAGKGFIDAGSGRCH
jgi:hypothetical protein